MEWGNACKNSLWVREWEKQKKKKKNKRKRNGLFGFGFGKIAGILADENACTVGFMRAVVLFILVPAFFIPRMPRHERGTWCLFALTYTRYPGTMFIGWTACTLRPTGVGGIGPSLFPDRPTKNAKPTGLTGDTGPTRLGGVFFGWLLEHALERSLRSMGWVPSTATHLLLGEAT